MRGCFEPESSLVQLQFIWKLRYGNFAKLSPSLFGNNFNLTCTCRRQFKGNFVFKKRRCQAIRKNKLDRGLSIVICLLNKIGRSIRYIQLQLFYHIFYQGIRIHQQQLIIHTTATCTQKSAKRKTFKHGRHTRTAFLGFILNKHIGLYLVYRSCNHYVNYRQGKNYNQQ